MKKSWHGILKIEELKVHENGKIIYEDFNIYNVMHQQGEYLILNALFKGGNTSNPYIPLNYYVGLDSRPSLSETQSLADVQFLEPSGNGYLRQSVSSTTGFTIVNTAPSKATSGIVSFAASGSAWGPVKNIFLCDVASGYTGNLISSVAIGSDITCNPSTVVSMKFSMTLTS